MKKDKPNVCVVTVPIGDNGIIPLSNLVNILYPISNNLHAITGGSGYTFANKSKKIHSAYDLGNKTSAESIFFDLSRAVITRLRLSYIILKQLKDIDLYIFFIGCESLLPATITAKLCGKKVLLALPGSAVDCLSFGRNPLSKLSHFMIKLNRILSHGIIIYSKRCLSKHDYEKYKNKIYIAREHQLNLFKFNSQIEYKKRNNVIGYIGSINEGKGVLNLVQAIQEITKKRNDFKFLIGGDGPAMPKIKEYIMENDLGDKVELVGWIPHDKIPDYLTKLKLFVLPSYTEGLPNIMLESMACGTPVLVTPVGAIPDFIIDGNNGFIMENNSPEHVSKYIIQIMNHSDLEQIAKNAKKLVKKDFKFDEVVEEWKKIIFNVV